MSGHSANVWTHGKCDPLVYLEERGCIPLVLCEEGRGIIQGSQKCICRHTGTHGVSCPIYAPFFQMTRHLAVCILTF